jgi:hypothetical protein
MPCTADGARAAVGWSPPSLAPAVATGSPASVSPAGHSPIPVTCRHSATWRPDPLGPRGLECTTGFKVVNPSGTTGVATAGRCPNSGEALVSRCRLAGVAAAAMALLVAGCSNDAPSVVEAYGDAGSTHLELGIDTCNRHPKVTALELGDEVRLTSPPARPPREPHPTGGRSEAGVDRAQADETGVPPTRHGLLRAVSGVVGT